MGCSDWQGIRRCQSDSQLNDRTVVNARRYDISIMSGLPASALIKIERANHHIADLEIEVSKFIGSGPYKTVGDIDADGRATYNLSSVQPIPLIIPTIAGEAIQSLRTALDYLACALWHRTHSGDCKGLYFPIAATPERFKAMCSGDVKSIGKDAIDAISAVEPYKGGYGNILWSLHHLSIVDKHRLPMAVVGGNLGVHLPSFYPELFHPSAKFNQWIVNVSDIRFSLKENDVLFRDEPGRELKQDYQFPFFIAFDEAGIFEREPLLPAIKRISEFVSTTVAGFNSLFI